ncbi:hypothetical protein WMY93_026830 [Mugilogobius chulae]|uniref:C-type lectin domain-containing protein n=1 Tax=Mugilogobius chulae TaxID=88201 RepID=A0AAW0N220_9GOBI
MSEPYSNVLEECKMEYEDKMNNDIKQYSRKRAGINKKAIWYFLGALAFILLVVIIIIVARHFMEFSSWKASQQSPYEFNSLSQRTMEKTRTGPCPSLDWLQVNGECFYISPKGVTKAWALSKKDCESRGGHLVTVKNWSKLELLIMFREEAWIGLSDKAKEGTWMWEDGTHFNESDLWMEGEPNDAEGKEDCAHLSTGGLNDILCRRAFPYICES